MRAVGHGGGKNGVTGVVKKRRCRLRGGGEVSSSLISKTAREPIAGFGAKIKVFP
jgi:hypothetical protein